ncbi:hypothetical protein [Planomicrobium okeanokoites]|uniref:Uncharacterized protein n=1 Tax=Planomicrobium okeanokoites TaxID=244 RepID=A0ABV7KLA4_PLAOK|nr:hypothetical protein [Planomicrobium okeanokoites]
MTRERMKKHVLLYGGIAMILLSFLAIHELTAPRIGPIGDGSSIPPPALIWRIFSLFILCGIGFIIWGIYRFLFKEKRTDNFMEVDNGEQ